MFILLTDLGATVTAMVALANRVARAVVATVVAAVAGSDMA
jgi:hypothetical protein